MQIPVNAFHIRRLVTWGSFILVDVENWLGNVRMYNGYIFVLFDLILYVHSTIFQLCGTGLPGLNQY